MRFPFQRSHQRMGNSDALFHVPFLRSTHDSDITPVLQNMRSTLQGDIVHSRATDRRTKGTDAVQENRHPHALLSINFCLFHQCDILSESTVDQWSLKFLDCPTA